MDIKKAQQAFVIENNELENYSFNIIYFYIEKHNYTIFNFDEKILENFNHPFYQIIYIYSKPLYNDVNIETLLEKLLIIKKRLKKDYFVFNPSILVIGTNCTLDFSKIEIPKYCDFINITEKESIYNNEIFKQVYPDIQTHPLNLSFEQLSIRLNALNYLNAKRINSIFNKKNYFINIILVALILIIYLLDKLSLSISAIPEFAYDIILSRENIENYKYYTLLTNNLFDVDLFSIGISIFLIVSLGVKLERIFGSLRYLAILLLTMVFTNSMLFAFIYADYYVVGFSPIIFTFIGAYLYVAIIFRRFLAKTLKRMFYLNLFFIFFIMLLGDKLTLISLICAIIAGFVGAFIVGIPKVYNGNKSHRILAGLLVLVSIILCIQIGLK